MSDGNIKQTRYNADKKAYKSKVRQQLYRKSVVRQPRDDEVKSIFERSLGKILIAVLTVYSLLGLVTFFAYENNILKFSIFLSVPLIFSMVYLLVNLVAKIIEVIEKKDKKRDVERFDKASIYLFMVMIGFLIFSWLLSDINFGNENMSEFEKNLRKFIAIFFEGSIMMFFQFRFILNVTDNPIKNRKIRFVKAIDESMHDMIDWGLKWKEFIFILVLIAHISANIIIFVIYRNEAILFDKITGIYASEFSLSIALYIINLILRLLWKDE